MISNQITFQMNLNHQNHLYFSIKQPSDPILRFYHKKPSNPVFHFSQSSTTVSLPLINNGLLLTSAVSHRGTGRVSGQGWQTFVL